jgi:hypothetical protein
VSQVAKTLDSAVAAFHRRPLQSRYKVLLLDGNAAARAVTVWRLKKNSGVESTR